MHAQGLAVELGSYQTHVFLDFREMADDADGRLARLAAYLHGRGVASLEKAGREMSLQPLHGALRDLCRPENILTRQLDDFSWPPGKQKRKRPLAGTGGKNFAICFSLPAQAPARDRRPAKTVEALLEDLLVLRAILRTARGSHLKSADTAPPARQYLQEHFREKPETERIFILALYVRGLLGTGGEKHPDCRVLYTEWMLDGILAEILRSWGISEPNDDPAQRMIRIACGSGDDDPRPLPGPGPGRGGCGERPPESWSRQ